MKNFRYLRDFVVAFCFLVLITLVALKLNQDTASEFRGAVRVVDGDTIIMGGERLRLSGIDAPEIHQSCHFGRTEWQCGLAARDQLERLVRLTDLVCQASRRDKYRRLLATCRAGGIDINREMVRTGLAVDYGAYAGDAEEARVGRRGLWASSFERPESWRRHEGSMEDGDGAEFGRFLSDIWASLADFFGVI